MQRKYVKRIKCLPTFFLYGLLTQICLLVQICFGTCCILFYYMNYYALNFAHKVHLQCSSHLIALCLAPILMAYGISKGFIVF